MIEIMLGCIAVLFACVLFMFVLIIRSISRQADELEERKRRLQKRMDARMDAIYPPGYLPGIDPEPEPPQLQIRKSW